MAIANVWGQGQLFAFSALDGNSKFGDDFVGILSGDKIGIRFFSKIKRELAIVGYQTNDLTFDAVLSDLISGNIKSGKIGFAYADTHLIVGICPDDSVAVVMVEGIYDKYTEDGVEIHDTKDGQFTAIARDGGKFAFALGNNKDEAVMLAKRGLLMSFDEVSAKKLEFYEKHEIKSEYSKLHNKCLSVMKTQLYSPEGKFDTIWSTPDRLPHKALWLWDSVFHAVGHRNYDAKLAEDLIHAIFVHQHEDGMISHMVKGDWSSKVTQPPVIAWGALKVYEKTGNKEFLKEVYEKNGAFLDWCRENRRESEEELYAWFTDDDKNCRCGESGMDNSPRFDEANHLHAIDFSCFMANDVRAMAEICEILGYDNSKYTKWYEEIVEAVNRVLWSDNFYYDFDCKKEKISYVKSVASFLPLFSGVCDKERAEILVKNLTDPKAFYTEFAIPSIATDDKTFGTDMWRGPVWINYNYMIAEGLRAYGYTELADEIISKTVKVINEWYEKTGTVYEFYDCENKKSPQLLTRKGEVIRPYNFEIRLQSIRDYGWTATLTYDMIENLI